jgi:ligand-binding sensor domain-containing protein
MLRALTMALFGCSLTFAGEPANEAMPPRARISFQSFTTDRGFPAAAVHAICQDQQGFMWFGTESGLVRYDGSSVRVLGRADGLPGEWASRLLAHPAGGLWAATTLGLVRVGPEGKIDAVQLDGKPYPSRILALDLDDQGRLLVALHRKVYRESSPLQLTSIQGYGGGEVADIWFGRASGSLWVASETGLWCLSKDGAWRAFGAREGLDFAPKEVSEAPDGRIWVVGARRLLCLPPGARRFEDRSSWMPGALFSQGRPYLDREGAIWIPTNAGALRVKGDAHRCLGQPEGLPTRWVKAVFQDREGTYWMLSSSIHKMLGQGAVLSLTQAEGLPSDIVWCELEDADGRLWIGTDDGVEGLTAKGLSHLPGTEGYSVHRMTMDRQGTVWIANSTGPALMLAKGASKAVPVKGLPPGARTSWVGTTRDDRIWYYIQGRGLIAYDPATRQTWSLERESPLLRSKGFHGAQSDPQGRIWFYGSRGLACQEGDRTLFLDASTGECPMSVNGIAFLSDGSAWIWSEEPLGLTQVRLQGDKLQVVGHLNAPSGLASDNVYDALLDAHSSLWVSTDRGIDHLTPEGTRHIGRGEGLLSEDCAENGLALDRQGNLWSGSTGGLIHIRASNLPPLLPPPAAKILRLDEGSRTHWTSLTALSPIKHQDANIEFFFSSPTYVNEAAVRYQVRLQGLEDNWRDTDLHRARYPALSGGTYTFEVRAARPGGAWGPPDALTVHVLPPWWRTWWFMGLEALAILGLVALVIRWRLATLEAQKRHLEALVKARTSDLVEANEALTLALSEIQTLQGLIPICSYCKKIREDDGFWKQLEHFFQQHTSAKFSHGICPECLPKVREEMGLLGTTPSSSAKERPGPAEPS